MAQKHGCGGRGTAAVLLRYRHRVQRVCMQAGPDRLQGFVGITFPMPWRLLRPSAPRGICVLDQHLANIHVPGIKSGHNAEQELL